MTAIAAARPRRRKRRPPRDRERWAMAMLVVFAAWTLISVLWLVTDGAPVLKAIDALTAVMLAWLVVNDYWPVVWNYLRNGYRDE